MLHYSVYAASLLQSRLVFLSAGYVSRGRELRVLTSVSHAQLSALRQGRKRRSSWKKLSSSESSKQLSRAGEQSVLGRGRSIVSTVGAGLEYSYWGGAGV